MVDSEIKIIERPNVDKEYATQYWRKMDDQFFVTLKCTQRTFYINLIINIFVIAVGLIILGYSIVYSWTNGLDLYSISFGSIGVATFMTTFFFTSQKKIHQATTNFVRLQILYKAFNTIWENVNDQLSDPKNNLSTDQMMDLNKHLASIAEKMVARMKESSEE